jgi:hypothetical protein
VQKNYSPIYFIHYYHTNIINFFNHLFCSQIVKKKELCISLCPSSKMTHLFSSAGARLALVEEEKKLIAEDSSEVVFSGKNNNKCYSPCATRRNNANKSKASARTRILLSPFVERARTVYTLMRARRKSTR